MVEMLVWILVSVSDGSYNRGNLYVVERFKSQEQCLHVQNNLPKGYFDSKCIQANILVQK